MRKRRQTDKPRQKYIYILNFGDYFARLTAKRIKELGGRPRIVSFNTPFADLKNPAGFILSGSPNGSTRIPIKLLSEELFATNYPVMGICVGAHLITKYFGGQYKNLKRQAEYGISTLYIDKKNKLLKGLGEKEEVVMMHQDSIVNPGKGFEIAAHTDNCKIAATMNKKWRWYTFQFHPELSPCGDIIFFNFINLCYKDPIKTKPKRSEIKIRIKFDEKIKPSLPELNNGGDSRLKKVLDLFLKKRIKIK